MWIICGLLIVDHLFLDKLHWRDVVNFDDYDDGRGSGTNILTFVELIENLRGFHEEKL